MACQLYYQHFKRKFGEGKKYSNPWRDLFQAVFFFLNYRKKISLTEIMTRFYEIH